MMHTHHQRLIRLSATYAALMALPGAAAGQIAYTNFDPDIVLDPDTDPWPHADYQYHYLDMNLDGATDFNFMAFASVSYSGWLTSNYYSNKQVMWLGDKQAFAGYSGSGFYYNASVFSYGQQIDNLLNWIEDAGPADGKTVEFKKFYHTPGTVIERGNWGGVNGQFVAVRLKTPGQKFYGWMRISVSEIGDSLTIHDFAYNTVSNAPILAGETGLDCAPPFPYYTQVLSPTQVKVKWQQVADAASYRIRYRPIGAPAWTTVKASATKSSRILSGLTCDTNYEWQIRVNCIDGSSSDWCEMQYFTPASCRLEAEAETVTQVELFPNPSSGMMQVALDGFGSDALEAVIFNMQGMALRSFVLDQQELQVISVDDLPPGNYFMRVTDGRLSHTVRFVVIP